MTTTSAQTTYSTGLTSEQLDALSALDTITLTTSGSSYYSPCYTTTIGTGTSTITFSNCYTSATTATCIPPINISNINNINIWANSEWINCFPNWSRIQEMCEEYPGLKIAFEKFKNTYQLVKDDYDAPPDKKIRP